MQGSPIPPGNRRIAGDERVIRKYFNELHQDIFPVFLKADPDIPFFNPLTYKIKK